ncbi:hypothetical protein MKX03_019889, partial [Papaver bracteatum]
TEHLTELVHKFKELKEISEHEVEKWYKTEEAFQNFKDFILQLLQEYRQASMSMHHVVNVMKNYGKDFTDMGTYGGSIYFS